MYYKHDRKNTEREREHLASAPLLGGSVLYCLLGSVVPKKPSERFIFTLVKLHLFVRESTVVSNIL